MGEVAMSHLGSTFQLQNFANLNEILEDLTARFIINIPTLELESIERVLFQIELAHWFYEDYILDEYKQLQQQQAGKKLGLKLNSFSLKHFSLLIFQSCILLKHWVPKHEKAFDTFMKYKVKVPVCGAIILNTDMSKVLLVRGWKSSSSWGFPKGKINQDEAETSCAIREVFEETGFDISPYLRDQEFLERRIYEQRVRLYMISGIDESVEFLTQTKKEIGDIKWHSLNSIPGFSKNSTIDEDDFIHSKNKKYKFYMITPFVVSIRKWISNFKAAKKEGKDRNRAGLRVTMDDEEAANDSEADLLNQAVSEQHHYFYHQQNPQIDQYSSAVVPQTQRVEMEESLKSLLGLGGTSEFPPHQQQQIFPGSHSYSQPLNIPMSQPQQGYVAGPHPPPLVGSFTHPQQPQFGSFGHIHPPSGPGMFYTSPIPPPNSMHLMGGNQSYPPHHYPQDDQNQQQPMFEMDVTPNEKAFADPIPVEEDAPLEKTGEEVQLTDDKGRQAISLNPDRQRKSALMDILMGSTPPETDSSSSEVPSTSVATGTTITSSAQPVSPKKKAKQLEKQVQQNALMDLLLTGNSSAAKSDKNASGAPPKSQQTLMDALLKPATVPSSSLPPPLAKSQTGVGKREETTSTTIAPSAANEGDTKKSPKKKKKDRGDGSVKEKDTSTAAPTSGLQFGAVQILKRPSSSSGSKSVGTASSEKKEEVVPIVVKKKEAQVQSEQRNEQQQQQQSKPKVSIPAPVVKTAAAARQDSSSQLLELINSTRKSTAADNQSLLDVLFHGSATAATPKSAASLAELAEDDPGLEMALSGRTISRSSSMASSAARVSSPTPGGAVLKERPSLVDILKGVPLPPSSSTGHYPQTLDYARSLSPTSPKVRPLSPERPSFLSKNMGTNHMGTKNGLLDILLGGPITESSSKSAATATSPSAKSPLSPSQQSLTDILQGVPNPTPPGSSLTDAFAEPNPSVVTSGSSVSMTANSTATSSKKEGKSSLMDILLGGFK